MLLLSLVVFEKGERKRERQEEDRKTGSGTERFSEFERQFDGWRSDEEASLRRRLNLEDCKDASRCEMMGLCVLLPWLSSSCSHQVGVSLHSPCCFFLGVPMFLQFYIKFYSSLLSLFFLFTHRTHLSWCDLTSHFRSIS
jgi:hypothetical protein